MSSKRNLKCKGQLSIGEKKKRARPEQTEEDFVRKHVEALKWDISYAGEVLVATNASMELYYEAEGSEGVPTSEKQEE